MVRRKYKPDIDTPLGFNTVEKFCNYYGISRDLLYKWSSRGQAFMLAMPIYRKGKLVKYQRLWVKSDKVENLIHKKKDKYKQRRGVYDAKSRMKAKSNEGD